MTNYELKVLVEGNVLTIPTTGLYIELKPVKNPSFKHKEIYEVDNKITDIRLDSIMIYTENGIAYRLSSIDDYNKTRIDRI